MLECRQGSWDCPQAGTLRRWWKAGSGQLAGMDQAPGSSQALLKQETTVTLHKDCPDTFLKDIMHNCMSVHWKT